MQKDLRTKKTGAEMFYTNPMIRKITRIDETSTDCATYSSIGNKCAFFMAMVLLGALLLGVLQMIDPAAITMDDGSVINMSTYALLAAIPFGLLFIIMPFIAIIIKKTIPVTGTLYLQLTGEDDPRYDKVRAIVNMFPGNQPVKVFFADTRKLRGTQAALDSRMLTELKNLLGEANVVVK